MKMYFKVTVVQCCNWPQQCSPLSTVFDLVKQVITSHHIYLEQNSLPKQTIKKEPKTS